MPTLTVTLTRDDISKAIKAYVEAQGDWEVVGDVAYNVTGATTIPYYVANHQFTGAATASASPASLNGASCRIQKRGEATASAA